MRRPVPSGTPERPTQYLKPQTHNRLLFASLAAPIVLLAGVFGFYRAGYTRLASPGPLTLRHTAIETRCEECHRSAFPHAVADIRCERCHDPRATGRLELSGHSQWNPPSHRPVGERPDPACADCHADHSGRSASAKTGDVRECATCHGFSKLDHHPEFAVTLANQRPTRGLRFGHQRHIDEARRTLGRGCEACHRPTADLSGFDPIAFDRHCAPCHTKGDVLPGMTEPVPGALVTSAGTISIRRAGRDRIVASGLTHRDPWIVANVRQLNRGLDAEGITRERAGLKVRLSDLEAARKAGPVTARSIDLEAAGGSAQADSNQHVQRVSQLALLERERQADGRGAPISLAASLSDDRALEAAIADVRVRLADLDNRLAPRPLSPAAQAAQSDAAGALLVPCVTCHELEQRTRLAPVRLGDARFPRAKFTHAPHVSQVACETCHTAVASSNAATDVITPDLRSCQSCHGTGQAPIACTGCHRFHPTPEAGLKVRAADFGGVLR